MSRSSSSSTANLQIAQHGPLPYPNLTTEQLDHMHRQIDEQGADSKKYQFFHDLEESRYTPFDPDSLSYLAATPALRARYAIQRDFLLVGFKDTSMLMPMVNGTPSPITREMLDEIKDLYRQGIALQYSITNTRTEHLQAIAAAWQKCAAVDRRFQKPYAEVKKSVMMAVVHMPKNAYEDLKKFDEDVSLMDEKLNSILNGLAENLKRLNALNARLSTELLSLDIDMTVEYELCTLRLKAYSNAITEYRKFFKRKVLSGIPVLTLTHPETQQGITGQLAESTDLIALNQTAVSKCDKSVNRINRVKRAASTSDGSGGSSSGSGDSSSSRSAPLPVAKTPAGRAYTKVLAYLEPFNIKFNPLFDVIDTELHPQITSVSLCDTIKQYRKVIAQSLVYPTTDDATFEEYTEAWYALCERVTPENAKPPMDMQAAEVLEVLHACMPAGFTTFLHRFNSESAVTIDSFEQMVSFALNSETVTNWRQLKKELIRLVDKKEVWSIDLETDYRFCNEFSGALLNIFNTVREYFMLYNKACNVNRATFLLPKQRNKLESLIDAFGCAENEISRTISACNKLVEVIESVFDTALVSNQMSRQAAITDTSQDQAYQMIQQDMIQFHCEIEPIVTMDVVHVRIDPIVNGPRVDIIFADCTASVSQLHVDMVMNQQPQDATKLTKLAEWQKLGVGSSVSSSFSSSSSSVAAPVKEHAKGKTKDTVSDVLTSPTGKYLTEQLERLDHMLSDTVADARAYRAAFTVLASVGLSVDTWVQLQSTAGVYSVTFPSDIIPDMCDAFADKLVTTLPPIGTDYAEAVSIMGSLPSAKKMLNNVDPAAVDALNPPEFVKFQTKISDWGRVVAKRLGPLVRMIETIVPRMEGIRRFLNKKRSHWPVDLEVDYNLCIAWKETVCIPLSMHADYMSKEVTPGVPFMHLMDKDARDACTLFVDRFTAGKEKLVNISDDVREKVERTFNNIERLKKEEAARGGVSATASDRQAIQPVQYQSASSSSSSSGGSSSTAVPNSQKRKEKIKTRAGQRQSHIAALDEEEGDNDDAPIIIDDIYLSDNDDDRPQGAGLTRLQLIQQQVAARAKERKWDKNRIRAVARQELMAEENARRVQREQIEAHRRKMDQINSQDDLPVVAAAPTGGCAKFTSNETIGGDDDGKMSYLPGGHTGHLTEKQKNKLAKKLTKSQTKSLSEFHAHMEMEKKRQADVIELTTRVNKQKKKKKDEKKKKK